MNFYLFLFEWLNKKSADCCGGIVPIKNESGLGCGRDISADLHYFLYEWPYIIGFIVIFRFIFPFVDYNKFVSIAVFAVLLATRDHQSGHWKCTQTHPHPPIATYDFFIMFVALYVCNNGFDLSAVCVFLYVMFSTMKCTQLLAAVLYPSI